MKNSFISSFKKIPLGFLLSLVLYFLFQFFFFHSSFVLEKFYLLSRSSVDDPFRVEAQLQLLDKSEGVKKVLLVGTSQTRENIVVSYLNEKFQEANLRFYNLGFSGCDGFDIYMLKDRIVRLQPDLVIYNPYIGTFYRDYDYSRLRMYFHPRIIPELVKEYGLKEILSKRLLVLDGFVGYASTFFKLRYCLQRLNYSFIATFLGMEEERKEIEYFALKERNPDSYFESAYKRENSDPFYFSRYTELEKKLYLQTLKEWKNKIKHLVLFDGPVHPRMEETFDGSVQQAYESFLTSSIDSLDIHYIGSDKLPEFTEKDFYDFTHMSDSGRIKLTLFLEKYIRNYMEINKFQS